MQTGGHSGSILSQVTSYGGLLSLYRGMAAPLSTACVVNAIIFSSYGWSSRVFDEYVERPASTTTTTTTTTFTHDSTIKAFTCGSFAGFVQGLVICPMEHMKCRLQVQHGKGSPDCVYKGPVHVARTIYSGYGISGKVYYLFCFCICVCLCGPRKKNEIIFRGVFLSARILMTISFLRGFAASLSLSNSLAPYL